MSEELTGTITALAIKSAHGAPMTESDEVNVTLEGINGNVHQRDHRRITFLSTELWAATCEELGVDLPWTTRRANVLVSNLDFSDLIGKNLRVGDVEVHVYGETHPCGQMDDAAPGLQAAMVPNLRGGVHGRVLQEGTIRSGDTISVIAKSNE